MGLHRRVITTLHRPERWLPVLLALALLPGVATAQASTADGRCAVVLGELSGGRINDSTATCFKLSAFIVDALQEGAWQDGAPVTGQVSPRDVQPENAGDATATGSLVQGEATPSVRPVALAGGSISAVGTGAGARALTSIAINPLLLFGNIDDPEKAATASRFTDLTFLLPVDKLDGNNDGRIDYFGVRARMNWFGLKAGSKVFTDVETAANKTMMEEVNLALTVETALNDAAPESIKECAEALLKAKPGSVVKSASCGGEVSFTPDTASYRELRESMRALRDAADRDYFGLDLRFDFGDPTLGDSAGADATTLAAGLGWGRQIASSGADVALKLHLGGKYVSLRDSSRTEFSIEGAAGFELSRKVEDQTLKIGAGLEFASGGADKAERVALQTDYVTFRGSLSIPLLNATTVSVTVSAPLYGEQSPTLSISGNWAMLLSAVAPAARRSPP